jgi:aldose 1-epimerase
MTEITDRRWGSLPSGEPINLYTLRNAGGMEASITNYGGRLVALKVPDRAGNREDVVLGFDTLEGYLGHNPYFGALVGRFANRIANGQFELGGKTYTLLKNNGSNALHGGAKGFDKVAWEAAPISANGTPALKLRYLSVDGEEGYPGNLDVHVTYTLGDDQALRIDYEATTDRDTVLNVTSHSYFNLAGHGHGGILDQEVIVNADRFTPVGANLIPTGELRGVKGTPFDFRQAAAIGARIDAEDEQVRYGKGYDHNFVLNRSGNGLSTAARVFDPHSGRGMEVLTTQPGMQFYTSNHITGEIKGKGGTVYRARSAFCCETQRFPDSPNQAKFPSAALKPGERYREATVFRFSTGAPA